MSSPERNTPTFNGTLTWEQFVQGCESLKSLNSDWIWVEFAKIPGGKFLSRNLLHPTPNAGNPFISLDIHILYSLSHSVPTLYYNCGLDDGSILTLEQVLELFIPDNNCRNFISQMEHPVNGKPFYTLHPCNTHKIMSGLLENIDDPLRYIVSWFSLTTTSLGLPCPDETRMVGLTT